jgi:uncharacterized membrane protein YtjA (UPF0391 family)
MLRWAMGLLVVALVTTMFGAGGIFFATEALRTLFYLFVVVLLATILPVLVSDRRNNMDEYHRDRRPRAASRA